MSIVFKREDSHYSSKYTAPITKSDIQCSNGYLNLIGRSFLSIKSHYTVVIENFLKDKANWNDVLNSIYDSFYYFVDHQLQLENLRLGKRQILPKNEILSGTYVSAYDLINKTNIILANVQTMQADSSLTLNDVELIVAQAHCIRAFTYYNLAMLWGNVIIKKEPDDDDDGNSYNSLPQSHQIDVYNFALSEICEALDKLPKTYNNQYNDSVKFTKDAGLILKAEIELTLGKKKDALNTLSSVKNNLEFCYVENPNKNRLAIYNIEKIALYKKEAIDNYDDIVQDWFDLQDCRYGYWATLKRLGKAREVTGCLEYELLMPFPSVEFKLNHQLQQNPGYY